MLWRKLKSLALCVLEYGEVPVIQRNDSVGTEAHRQYGYGGIHGAQRHIRVSAYETGYTHPVIRVRRNHREIRKPFQEAGFHVRAVTLTEEIGYFGHAQCRDDDVRPAFRHGLDARRMIGVRDVYRR